MPKGLMYLIIVGDGMADYPVEEAGGKTPLQLAYKPNMDYIAGRSRMGMLRTLRPDLPKGSDVANLIILGYDPYVCYTGRGPLEAAARRIRVEDDEVVFRCNLITVEGGRILDYSGEHVTTDEARLLISVLNDRLNELGRFHAGVSYRNLFISKIGEGLKATPPHDIVGEKYEEHMLKPLNEDSRRLNEMMLKSISILSENPVNKRRIDSGKRPANMVWIWGQGRMPRLEPFSEKHGLKGTVISAVDLIKGIGWLAGMVVPEVPGATGYYDTNYENKALYAVNALEDSDFVYLHVEAPDEAGHEGSFKTKVRVIEEMDRRLIGRILDNIRIDDVSISILIDHPTPVSVKNHTVDPVPFAIMKPGIKGDGKPFDEESGSKGSFSMIDGMDFIKILKEA
ncbi:MAG: cofactor-independent phosphoglycerate mutase [Candidatus Brockarchaeota archaeon]|nr:cofactor-independent phosphoglycerate mutase [Candidatus Brockarchaeota archaeon]